MEAITRSDVFNKYTVGKYVIDFTTLGIPTVRIYGVHDMICICFGYHLELEVVEKNKDLWHSYMLIFLHAFNYKYYFRFITTHFIILLYIFSHFGIECIIIFVWLFAFLFMNTIASFG